MNNRFVEASIEIESHQKTVAIEAFIDPDHLQAWWKVERSRIDLKPGGIYALAWGISDGGMDYVSTGLVRSFRSGSHLLLDKLIYFNPKIQILGPMALDIRLVKKSEKDILLVKQYGYQEGPDWDWYYEAVRVGWPQALRDLQRYLDTL